MSSQDSGPSTYSVSSQKRRIDKYSNTCTSPQRSMPLHHRRASGSALTLRTQFSKHHLVGHSLTHEYPSSPLFSYKLNSVLESPYLTTADVQTLSHNLDNSEREGMDPHRLRPPSPAPTTGYSIINVEGLEGDDAPTLPIPGSYFYAHRRSLSSSFAEYGVQSPAACISASGGTYYTSSGFGGASFLTLNHPTGSISLPNMNQHSNPIRTLLPRIWDVLSSPWKALYGNPSTNSPSIPSLVSISPSPAGSPTIFSQSISLPTQLFNSQSLSSRHSPLLWNNNHGKLSKGKNRARSSDHISEPVGDTDFSDLTPLDGEEGELIDEACFVDVRAVTGVDILRSLPPELAVYILQLVAPPRIRHDRHLTNAAGELDPLSHETERESDIALHAILACLAVSRSWRRLASDNSVWHTLFLGRWTVDLRRADQMHLKKLEEDLSPNRQLKRHRWKLIPKAQALRFAASSKYGASANTCPQSSLLVLHLAPKALCYPKHKFPLQFDWKKLYMDRLELERRWLGKSYTQIPVLLPREPQRGRETGRFMNFHEGMRSRSLSPAGHLKNDAFHSTNNSESLERTSGETLNRRAIPASRTEPVNMDVLYRSERREPEARELRGHTDSVYCVEFDSKRIITGSRDRTIMVWSLKTGRLLGTFAGVHSGSVLCLKFEKDWDLDPVDIPSGQMHKDGMSLILSTGVEMEANLNGVSNSTGFMVTGSSDCTICVWSLDTGEILDEDFDDISFEGEDDPDRRVVADPVASLKGHTGGVLDLRIDSQWIVSCSKDTVIRIWDRKTLEVYRVLRGHEGPVNAIGLQNDRVVSAGGDGKMILWDIESGERLRTFDCHDRGLACIDFKDSLIVSGSNDCNIRVWNARTGECLMVLAGHNALVRAISFDPQTGRLLSASYDKVVKVWDLYSGRLIREFKYTHTSHIFDVKFNLGWIVSASHDQRICVLDFTTGLNTSIFI